MTHSLSDAAKAQAATVDLWYSRCGSATASALAIRQGWLQTEFAKPGTRLHSLKASPDENIRQAHYHHQLSGLVREGGNIPPIWARAAGYNTAVVAITWLDEYQGILVRADSPVQGIADLAGRRLALPRNDNLVDFQRGAALHGFVTALSLAGLQADAVQFVDLPGTTGQVPRVQGQATHRELDALLSGTVDAVFLRSSFGVRSARDPRFRQIVNLNEQSDPLLRVNNGTPRPVTVNRDLLQRHPDLVVRYLAVLLRTAAWAAQHPRETQELLVQESAGSQVEDVLASHGAEVHRSFTPKLSTEYIRGLEVQKNFLRDWHFLHADFEINDWIVTEPLAQALELVAAESAPARLAGAAEPAAQPA